MVRVGPRQPFPIAVDRPVAPMHGQVRPRRRERIVLERPQCVRSCRFRAADAMSPASRRDPAVVITRCAPACVRKRDGCCDSAMSPRSPLTSITSALSSVASTSCERSLSQRAIVDAEYRQVQSAFGRTRARRISAGRSPERRRLPSSVRPYPYARTRATVAPESVGRPKHSARVRSRFRVHQRSRWRWQWVHRVMASMTTPSTGRGRQAQPPAHHCGRNTAPITKMRLITAIPDGSSAAKCRPDAASVTRNRGSAMTGSLRSVAHPTIERHSGDVSGVDPRSQGAPRHRHRTATRSHRRSRRAAPFEHRRRTRQLRKRQTHGTRRRRKPALLGREVGMPIGVRLNRRTGRSPSRVRSCSHVIAYVGIRDR
jgi:hypothetical protein